MPVCGIPVVCTNKSLLIGEYEVARKPDGKSVDRVVYDDVVPFDDVAPDVEARDPSGLVVYDDDDQPAVAASENTSAVTVGPDFQL